MSLVRTQHRALLNTRNLRKFSNSAHPIGLHFPDKFLTTGRMKAKFAPVKEKRLSEKVGNVTIPIYPTSTKGYDGFTVVWYEAGKRCRKFFAFEQFQKGATAR